MKGNKCCDLQDHEAILDALNDKKKKAEIEEHARHCSKCRVLIQALLTPEPDELKKDAETNQKLFSLPRPDKIIPGQLWQMEYNEKYGKRPIALVTKGTEISIDDNARDLRVALVNLSFDFDQLEKDEPVVKESESSFNKEFLVEYWNERPISEASLKQYLGDVDKKVLTRLYDLMHKTEAVELDEVIKDFRDARIARSASLSQDAVRRIMELCQPEDDKSESWATTILDKIFGKIIPVNQPTIALASHSKNLVASEHFKTLIKQIEEYLDKTFNEKLDIYPSLEKLVICLPEGLPEFVIELLNKEDQVLKIFEIEENELVIAKDDFDNWEQVEKFKFEGI